ncbi:CDP-glucose 4,6-dehydratase [Lutimaribacter sp. EGI FJ00015]|uniref:CDP-glucose 4,6-dehydratase n=1 Tax=Lutimaribacter degradans TaxID=2945989 RepID=A0ACC5ZZJ9_9RHOB|nr:CDP-glucose 4,6-dehydratase [Lutimaribacter sp. EGI FJ00013]MCO0614953.1 CDP-glucose 4,6-dehydratase [Lutimaribacter sp. EGI FJ00015]MCO0637655.1 CDP-glucose 4,6-dehydratase [Lutimaribacter sp. EGI FJ00014]
MRRPDPSFWRGRPVLLTGHTGFKGGWTALMLDALGARVTGLALDPEPGLSAHDALGGAARLDRDLRRDIRATGAIGDAVPEGGVVLHLAAQAIVGRGHRDPSGTWSANLDGTRTLLDAAAGMPIAAAVIVTSDKVYRQTGARRPFVEADALGGEDPYSASKAACELLVASYRKAGRITVPIATARAGNVIGGGDLGEDRLIPDLVRAMAAGQSLRLRHPDATRPFQHVLDVICGYLLLAETLASGPAPEAVNFGPAEAETRVRDLLDLWARATGTAIDWAQDAAPAYPEQPRLALDSSLACTALGWAPLMSVGMAAAETACWYRDRLAGRDMAKISRDTIQTYLHGDLIA